jgi:histidinol-phosphatase
MQDVQLMQFTKRDAIKMVLACFCGGGAAIISVFLHRVWINSVLPFGFILVVLFLLSCGCVIRAYINKIAVYAFGIVNSFVCYFLATLSTGDLLVLGGGIPGEQFWSGYLGWALILGSFLVPFLATLLPHKWFIQIKRTPVWLNSDKDIDFILDLVATTDIMIEEAFLSGKFDISTKKDGTPVTEIDRAVEDFIRKQINKRFPNDEILGEEFGASDPARQDLSTPASTAPRHPDTGAAWGQDLNAQDLSTTIEQVQQSDPEHDLWPSQDDGRVTPDSRAARRWIIDPIDGTKNFVRGVPVVGTLIGIEELVDGVRRPTKGVVSAPLLRRRWWGISTGLPASPSPQDDGHSPRADGDGRLEAWTQFDQYPPKRIHVSEIDALDQATVSLSSQGSWYSARPDKVQWLDQVCKGAARTRGYGDFFSYMLLAQGSVDIATEPELELYDVAALIPIVQGAGGVITDVDGKPWQTSEGILSALATTTNVHV